MAHFLMRGATPREEARRRTEVSKTKTLGDPIFYYLDKEDVYQS